MPILGLLHLLIGITCAVHAIKTGRHWAWVMILMAVPMVGAIAYFAVELLPDLAASRRARQVAGDLKDVVDPDREFRRRIEMMRTTDSADARRALAEECERKGMWRDAIELYTAAAVGVFKDDPALLFPLARAQLNGGDPAAAEATLDRLRAARPDWKSQEGQLVHARSLEQQGKTALALAAYETLARTYAGVEAKVRYALLLQKQGDLARARMMFETALRSAQAGAQVLSSADREWAKVARANV